MRIAVVDDEKEIADLVKTVLVNEGYEVDAYYNAKQALDAMLEQPPDLAILDVMMPEIDGFTLCARLRQSITALPLAAAVLLLSTAGAAVLHRAINR